MSVCLCLCVCPVRAPTFESIDLETFWYGDTSSEYLGQVHMLRSSGQGQGHRIKKTRFTSVTRCTHSRVVRLRLEGKRVLNVYAECTENRELHIVTLIVVYIYLPHVTMRLVKMRRVSVFIRPLTLTISWHVILIKEMLTTCIANGKRH